MKTVPKEHRIIELISYNTKHFSRMIEVLKFTCFNVILGLTDVLTDLSTFFFLLAEDHVLWALLTAQWMLMPFLVHAFDFIIR